MSTTNKKDPKDSSWYWGMGFSLFLHGLILFLALFWGFGSIGDSGAPAPAGYLEGRLVSLSELDGPPGGKTPTSGEKLQVEEPAAPEVKKEQAKEEVKVKEPEKKEVKETKKEEVKKVEEKPDEKAIPLETFKEKKKKEKEKKKEEKKEVAKVEATPKPKEKESEEKKSENKKTKEQVLAQMQSEVADKRRLGIIEEMKRGVSDGSKAESLEEGSGRSRGGYGGYRGQSTGGSSRGMIASDFARKLSNEIKSQWGVLLNIPKDGSLKTTVSFRMDEQGNVYNVKIEEASRNPLFDDFCVKAIRKAAPLKTVVPPEILEEIATDGLSISFRNTP